MINKAPESCGECKFIEEECDTWWWCCDHPSLSGNMIRIDADDPPPENCPLRKKE